MNDGAFHVSRERAVALAQVRTDVRVRRGLRGSRLALPSMLRDWSEAAITASSVNVSSAAVSPSTKKSLMHGRPPRPLSRQSKARPSVTAWVGSGTGDYAKCAGYILPLAAFLGNLPPSSATAQGLPAPPN
ncbi:hypothetical protein BDN71DRAFT_1510523 [Pleurotus eryngii]|uniref:Uncharacterized protein n=1 Tax=Pleurotus eryngii TaxID=5323 RepID=A0A9P5ZNC3_PLEER|nr:hypothetical protein BDN71DRAFT_1510523 [Pleurotus eryngii]